MKLTTTLMIGLMIIAGAFAGCSSGSGNKSIPMPPDSGELPPQPNDKANQGLLLYDKYDQMFYPPKVTKNTNKAQLLDGTTTATFQYNNSSCKSVMTSASEDSTYNNLLKLGLGKVSGVFAKKGMPAMFGDAAPLVTLGYKILKDVNKDVKDTNSYSPTTPIGTCLTSIESQTAAEFYALQNQINVLDEQVANLNNEYTELNTAFYQQNYTNAVQIAGLNKVSLDDAYSFIYGRYDVETRRTVSNGLMQEFMNSSGLWNNGVPVESMSIDAVFADPYSNVKLFGLVNSSAQSFQKAVQDLSGSQLDVNCSNNCYATVEVFNNSALLNSYRSLYQAYLESVVVLNNQNSLAFKNNTNNYVNIVPTIDAYNNTISSIFVRSLIALNYSYAMEYMSNEYNFNLYANSTAASRVVPLNLGQVNNTIFMPNYNLSADQNVANYNYNQLQLTKLYAARINVLLENTYAYTITDHPEIIAQPFIESNVTYYIATEKANVFIESHVSPARAARINNNVVKILSSKVKSPLYVSFPGGGYKNQTVFYQSPTILNASCLSAIESYNLNYGAITQSFESYITSACSKNGVYIDAGGFTVNQAMYLESYMLTPYYISNNKVWRSLPIYYNIAECMIGNSVGNMTGDLYFYDATHGGIKTNIASGESVVLPYLSCNLWKSNPLYNTARARASAWQSDYKGNNTLSSGQNVIPGQYWYDLYQTDQGDTNYMPGIVGLTAANTYTAIGLGPQGQGYTSTRSWGTGHIPRGVSRPAGGPQNQSFPGAYFTSKYDSNTPVMLAALPYDSTPSQGSGNELPLQPIFATNDSIFSLNPNNQTAIPYGSYLSSSKVSPALGSNMFLVNNGGANVNNVENYLHLNMKIYGGLIVPVVVAIGNETILPAVMSNLTGPSTAVGLMSYWSLPPSNPQGGNGTETYPVSGSLGALACNISSKVTTMPITSNYLSSTVSNTYASYSMYAPQPHGTQLCTDGMVNAINDQFGQVIRNTEIGVNIWGADGVNKVDGVQPNPTGDPNAVYATGAFFPAMSAAIVNGSAQLTHAQMAYISGNGIAANWITYGFDDAVPQWVIFLANRDTSSSNTPSTKTIWGGGVGGKPTYLRNSLTVPQNNICLDGSAGCSASFLTANDTKVNSIVSDNGNYKVTLQQDGQLVIFGPNSKPIWSLQTGCGMNGLLWLVSGDLFAYDSNYHTTWRTQNNFVGGGQLIMQDDGNLVLYAGSTAIWASGIH